MDCLCPSVRTTNPEKQLTFSCVHFNGMEYEAYERQTERERVSVVVLLTNFGAGTAWFRLLWLTSLPLWAEATNLRATKNPWRAKQNRVSNDNERV